MLHPDPMGSPFADAAVSLLRKLTFKGKWTLAFCNIQIPPVHYHNIKFILFFPPPGLNVCSHDRPSEPWYKCEQHRKSPMITRCPLGWAGDSLHSLWNGNISRHLISPVRSCAMPTLKLPILCQRGQSTEKQGNKWLEIILCIFLKEALKHLEMEISGIKYVLINPPPILHPKLCSCEHCVSQRWGHHLVTSTEAAFTLPHLEKFASQLTVTDQCENWYFTTESGKTIISKVDYSYKPQMLQHSIFFCFLNWFMLAIFTPD